MRNTQPIKVFLGYLTVIVGHNWLKLWKENDVKLCDVKICDFVKCVQQNVNHGRDLTWIFPFQTLC